MKKFFSRLFRAIFPVAKNTDQHEIPNEVIEDSEVNDISDDPALQEEVACLINRQGLDLIQHFEGFYSKPYICPAGVPTIGYGTIKYPNGKKVTLRDPACTKDQAREWMKTEVNEKASAILNYCSRYGVSLNENQLAALTSFAFNLGEGIPCNPSNSVGRPLSQGNMNGVASGMMLYNKARVKGPFGIRRLKELPGLTRRRVAEKKLFLKF